MPPDRQLLETIRGQAVSRQRFKPREDRGERPRVGEIRLARALSTTAQRLVLVLRVRAELNYAEVCLLSNELDMMSDYDFVLARGDTGLPFDVVAELDLAAPVYLIQTSNLFGRVRSKTLTQELEAASKGDVRRLSPSLRGMPIRGPADPRWGYKEAELSSLYQLSRECAHDLSEGKTVPRMVIDPALLDEVVSSRGADPLEGMDEFLAVSAVAHGGVASGSQISRLLDEFESLFALDPTFQIAIQPLLEAGLSGLSERPSDSAVEFRPGRRATGGELDRELGQLVAGIASDCGSLIRLATTEAAWAEGALEGIPMTFLLAGRDPLFADARDPRRQACQLM
jgi:hypothetical protein